MCMNMCVYVYVHKNMYVCCLHTFVLVFLCTSQQESGLWTCIFLILSTWGVADSALKGRDLVKSFG